MQERRYAQAGGESLFKKSRLFKVGAATTVGAIFLLPLAAIGIGAMASSAVWHSEKNPFNKGK